MSSVIGELDNRTIEFADKLLYAFLDINAEITESYTYKEFNERTKSLAQQLQKNYDLKKGERVLLAYPAGLEMICAFYACARIGVIPVPVYPPGQSGFKASLNKIEFIARDCDASAVLTTHSYQWSYKLNMNREQHVSDTLDHLKWIATNTMQNVVAIDLKEEHSDILFLQYTSGSTNDPKGVMVSHDNIIDNFKNVVDHMPIGVSWLPQYHDMGLIGYYIFFALKGGTTYGFSPTDFIRRPSLWLEAISKFKGSASSAPNFAFEYCLMPGKISEDLLATLDLSSLRFFMNAAEPIDTKLFNEFVDKFSSYGLNAESSFAAYGLAENTLAVTNYGRRSIAVDPLLLKKNELKVVDSTEGASLMSCGVPLGDTKVKIVDPSSMKQLQPMEIGEIWVSGSSRCQGYWEHPQLSKEIFEAKISNGDPNIDWMRTGDLGFMDDGELFVCGRLKDLVIIRGLNYYPQDIEAIAEQEAEVRKGCVAAFSIEEDRHEKLVLVVGIKRLKKLPDPYEINQKIVSQLGVSADYICFVPARTVARTSSGKIMRYKNKQSYLNAQLDVISQYKIGEMNVLDSNHQDELEINVDHKPQPGLAGLFKFYHLNKEDAMSLGESGLDSLKLAEFSHDLQEYVKKLGFADLSEGLDLRIVQKIAISELYELIKDLELSGITSKLKFKKAILRIHGEFLELEKEMMRKDAHCSFAGLSSDQQPEKGAILLTGGTGFFGPFLIKSLLEQNSDLIYILVRADNQEKAAERVGSAMSDLLKDQYLKESYEARVNFVCGDLSRPKLGLPSQDWDLLCSTIGTIYHNGAKVNYLADYEFMRSSNVYGTQEVIRLANNEERPKILNYISTTFIFGWSTKDTLFEVDANDDMELLDFGYSQSKWVADQVVLDAIEKGLNARIFRPALISPSIHGEGYNFDISIRLLVFMIQNSIGTTAKNQVSFTPADLAANNIVAISNLEESLNKTFHVTRDEYSSMKEVTDILSELAEVQFENFDLDSFVPEVVARCGKDDLLFPLLNFLVKSVDNISAMEFKRYDNSNYIKFRNASTWGKQDPSLQEVVGGIYKFILRHNLYQPKQIMKL